MHAFMYRKIEIVSKCARALIAGISSMHPAQVIIFILYSRKTHRTHAAYYFTCRHRVSVRHVAVKAPFAIELQITRFTFKVGINFTLVHFAALAI